MSTEPGARSREDATDGETPSTALDPSEASLIERNLSLTPEQRIDQLASTVEFIEPMRTAVARKRG